MSRAARRRDQVDASQSGVRLHFDRRFISQPSALAVRADCENQLGSGRLRTLHPLSAVGDPRVEVSFQSSSCCFGPGFCLPKPWSVILYRALLNRRLATSDSVSACRIRVQSFCTARVRAVCENRPAAVHINPLSRPPVARDRWSDVSFCLLPCHTDRGICWSKPCSVDLYRAF